MEIVAATSTFAIGALMSAALTYLVAAQPWKLRAMAAEKNLRVEDAKLGAMASRAHELEQELQGLRLQLQEVRDKLIHTEAALEAEPHLRPGPIGYLERIEDQIRKNFSELALSTLRVKDVALDILQLNAAKARLARPQHLRILTHHPVAETSADHLHPRGAENDETRHPRFVSACERVLGKPIRHLDLGCAGGGLVWDFLLAGHTSHGIEGSDYCRVNRRAYWRVIPDNLHTADITQPFELVGEDGHQQRFDLITAWEVLEHLSESDLPKLLSNLHHNLTPTGLFVASIATFPDEDPKVGAVWHVTIQPKEWWMSLFESNGFMSVEGPFEPPDYVRGSGNPRANDWDAALHPEMGFHVVLRPRSGSA